MEVVEKRTTENLKIRICFMSLNKKYTKKEEMCMLEQLQLEQKQKEFFYAISRIYDSVITINLTKNEYRNAMEGSFGIPKNKAGDLTRLMKRIKERSHIEDEETINRLQPENIKQELQNGKEEILEQLRQKVMGAYHWYSIRIEQIKDRKKHEIWAIVFVRNIDKQKEIEQQLEKTKEKINEKIKSEQEAALNSIPGFVIRFKVKGMPCELESTQKFYDYWGTEPKDYHDMAFYKMEETDLFYFLENYLGKMQNGEKISVKYRARNAKNELVYMQLEASCIGLKNGCPQYVGVMLDITDKIHAEEKLLKQTEFLQNVYDTVVVAIQQIRRNDIQLLTSNRGSLKLLECNEYEYRKLLKSREWKVKFPEDLERIKNIFYGLKLEQESIPIEVCIFTEKNNERWIALTLKRILNHKHEDIIQLEFTDITELKILKEKEEEFLVLQKANQAKTHFLSKMSHEIKTPMNGIMGLAEIALKSLENPEKVKDCLKKILSNSKFLQSLFNDILDMSKIENGKIRLCEENFCLDEWLLEIRDIFFSIAQEKSILFRIKTDYIHSIVIGDKMRLGQVLMNLIGNALKFTSVSGIVEVVVKEKEQKSEGISLFTFQVKDTGIGILKEKQQKIFQAFEQEDMFITKNFGGSGLGLAISENLIEMMGGKIEVLSEKGEGAEFYFTIPLKTQVVSIKQLPEKKKVKKKEYYFNNKRILVVEDNPLNAEIAQTLLAMAGCEVDIANNGEKAVKIFQEQKEEYYQLILMDIQMPVLNGLEATKRIRSMEKGKTIPILAMSANDFETDRQIAKEVGIDGYIPKPIEVETFYQTIEQQWKKRAEI